MHLMSFYASPYGVARDAKASTNNNKIKQILLFLSGIILGGLLVLWTIAPKEVNLSVGETNNLEALLNEKNVSQSPTSQAVDNNSNQLLTEDVAIEPEKILAEKPVPAWPLQVEVIVASGDTLIDVMVKQGIDAVAAHRLAKQVNQVYNLRRLRPGHVISMTLAQDDSRQAQADFTPTKLQEMQMVISDLETLRVESLENDKYNVKIAKKKLVSEPARTKTTIVGSFYNTLMRRGLPKESINGLIKNFSYEIDFQRDIKAGDVVDVMYENKKTEEGKVVSKGDIVYAMLKSDGKVIRHYRFEDAFGVARYYNEKGESIIKRFLRTPIDGARVSSRFGMRHHPIMGYSKMHQGVDFAAPTGTPIFAAGDGIVQQAGWQGGYGNIVQIKHNGTFTTAYAHASRIHPSIRRGVRVRQGQIIAYVGSTGNSTGAHLHYEIRRYGRQINPLGVQVANGSDKLQGSRLVAFKQHMTQVHRQLSALAPNGEKKVALAE
jgi:murein DD-endopeptidase MepM/ murein hydrolase activator NlpD